MENSQNTEEAKPIEFKIYSTSVTSFDFIDRIRVLFGKKLHLNFTITVDKEVKVIKPTETKSYTDTIFHKKAVKYECKSDNNL